MTKEQEELINKNHKLIYGFLKDNKYDFEEYYGLAAIGLCKAAIGYNPTKSSFSTYAYKCMRNQVFLEYRDKLKNVPKDKILYYDIAIDKDTERDSYLSCLTFDEDIMENIILNDCISRLPYKCQRVVNDMLNGETQLEIANKMKTTKQNISHIWLKSIRLLEEMNKGE